MLTLNGPVSVNVESPAAKPKVNWQEGKTTGVVVPALLEVQVAVVESYMLPDVACPKVPVVSLTSR
jgi:hypothetical protein